MKFVIVAVLFFCVTSCYAQGAASGGAKDLTTLIESGAQSLIKGLEGWAAQASQIAVIGPLAAELLNLVGSLVLVIPSLLASLVAALTYLVSFLISPLRVFFGQI